MTIEQYDNRNKGKVYPALSTRKSISQRKGGVYLVGAGPGDPGLITFKGLECLKKADVVIYDRLVSQKLLRYLPAKAQIIYCGKSARKHTLSQDEINSLLVKKAKEAKTVVRLKCGDPFLFGRGAEEALFLARHKVPFEIVPGVTTATAVPAYAGIPLTHRAYTSSVGIFTGHEDAAKESSRIDWEKITTGLGTLVFLMGVENLNTIVNNLIRYGRPSSTACCLIQQGTLPQQKTLYADLETIVKKAKQNNIQPPAILVVGDVVSLRERLNWFEDKPLFGKRILITRPLEAENRLCKILEDYGACCREMPAVELRPLKNYAQLDSQIQKIDDFRWIIFSSQNAVKFFIQRLDCFKKDVRILKGVKIAAIGPGTAAALEQVGLRGDLKPKRFCQEGLLERFKKMNLKKKNILIVCAQEAREVLAQGLMKMGANVKRAPAYMIRQSPALPSASPRGERKDRQSANRQSQSFTDIDIITFTSAQAVKNFFKVSSKAAFQKLKKRPLIAAIGPITSAQVRSIGLRVTIEAKKYTFEGLAEAIVRYYRR